MNGPPAIRSARKSTSGVSAAWALATLLFLLALARLSSEWNLPLPFCGWKKLTGIPCPFCGSARCFQACACFAFGDALRWNPLMFFVSLGTVLWFIVWTADRLFNRRWLASARPRVVARAFSPIFISAVVLNWIYLCLTLP